MGKITITANELFLDNPHYKFLAKEFLKISNSLTLNLKEDLEFYAFEYYKGNLQFDLSLPDIRDFWGNVYPYEYNKLKTAFEKYNFNKDFEDQLKLA